MEKTEGGKKKGQWCGWSLRNRRYFYPLLWKHGAWLHLRVHGRLWLCNWLVYLLGGAILSQGFWSENSSDLYF